MKKNPKLIGKLAEIRETLLRVEKKHRADITAVHPDKRPSARNLIHYLALRTYNLRRVQEQLSDMGLSSVSSAEGYVLRNITQVLQILQTLEGITDPVQPRGGGYKQSRKVLRKNSKALFGALPKKKPAHIMVTLPTEAAVNYELVKQLVLQGMDIARINLGHDNRKTWEAMASNVRKAAKKQARPCQVYMDLSGPKIRTGPVELTVRKKKKPLDFLLLQVGDKLELYRSSVNGRSAQRREDGTEIKPARIAISLPEVFDDLRPGQRIWFDDGKIGGVVRSIGRKKASVEITRTGINGGKLRAEKGINLPDTDLQLPYLTDEDLAALPLVTELADIVGYSFVRRASDVRALRHTLAEIGRPDIGLVLKIENAEAFNNLPELLLAAMHGPLAGVMVARGDLAVELGFERIAEVQEEILWLCEAAHMPVIWATQVLENLAKKGIASRAEVTDAAMAARAECVMLNKGPYILETVETLQNIMQRMQPHQVKKKGRYRPLHLAKKFVGRTTI